MAFTFYNNKFQYDRFQTTGFLSIILKKQIKYTEYESVCSRSGKAPKTTVI